MRKKTPVIIKNLQENNKPDCFYGQKSFRLGRMYNKRFFQINKEKIIQIRSVRKESAVKKIRVTKPYYYNINKRSQFLSKIVNITSKKKQNIKIKQENHKYKNFF
jgi:hypothetical protein